MDTLFHYCSSASFASIISNRTIWLSSLSLSNDSMEGRLVAQVLERLLLNSEVEPEQMQQIRDALNYIEEVFDGLGFCLSEKPDTLSQWRGYADDGKGFSIGFSKAYLDELAANREDDESWFRVKKVLYKPEEHEEVIKPIFEEIKSLVGSGKLKKPVNSLLNQLSSDAMEKRTLEYGAFIRKLFVKISKTLSSRYVLKSNAFHEEAEWRLISFLAKDTDDITLVRPGNDRLIPYRKYELKKLKKEAITKVYVGPKNVTPKYVIEKLLAQEGFLDVVVERSTASYR